MKLEKTLKAPIWFENSHWFVGEQGVVDKETNTIVTWDQVNTFAQLSVSTIHSFWEQPWPFWESTKKEAWFDYVSYSEAFRYALGCVVIKRFHQKAARRYLQNYPNEFPKD
jgi:hypothetical protein